MADAESAAKEYPNRDVFVPPEKETQTEVQGTQETQTEGDNCLSFSRFRLFKKSSPNNKFTLYLASRDLIVSEGKIDKLQGVLLVDPEYLQDKKVYGQVTLTFRYGREDEEVMGLQFCNEAVMCLAQLYPPFAGAEHQEPTTPLQETLLRRLGSNAYAFTMGMTPLAPPSVQLVPAKEYNGPPIGTSYKVKVYVANCADGEQNRKSIVQMGIRVIQRTNLPPPPTTTLYSVGSTSGPSLISRVVAGDIQRFMSVDNDSEIMSDTEPTPPSAAVEKPFLLSDGRVLLEAKLNRAIYAHGDPIEVNVNVTNNSNKSVRRIKVFVVQHVDVCMFSNGKFKNVVALVSSRDGCPIGPGSSLSMTYTLRPVKSSTKNWIALEDSYTKPGATLASTMVCSGVGPEERNVFAIYVSYYVKVKLMISAMGGDVSLKLPFTLMHSVNDPDLVKFPSPVRKTSKSAITITPPEEDSSHKENVLSDKGKPTRKDQQKTESIERMERKTSNMDLIERYSERTPGCIEEQSIQKREKLEQQNLQGGLQHSTSLVVLQKSIVVKVVQAKTFLTEECSTDRRLEWHTEVGTRRLAP
ncbi:phosrestin-2 [Orussus abietinus]|uniref:phosrestin-2 n=1 Tax=Orussus abietinus TaxID=222816 RepID=UPI000C7160EF|nr:phosrestin-2 [Orussus abietinus]